VTAAALSISGPMEVIQQLADRMSAAGIEISEPTELDAADMLNAPWNKTKVLAVSGVVTAMLELGAGGVSLANAISEGLHSSSGPATVIVIDHATSPTGGQQIPTGSSASQIQQAIDAALSRA
jgi:hypothetical protein